MPVGALAVMVQGSVNFQGQGEREKTHSGDHGKERSIKTSILGDIGLKMCYVLLV
jgi:hypothetical protein